MTAVAIIVEHETPDLLALCLASLKRFAPNVRPLVRSGYEGATAHAAEIEAARRHQLPGDAQIVILLDTDVMICSDQWIPWIEQELRKGYYALGGLRHRGDVTQIFCDGRLLLHAHCLAMRARWFEQVPSFQAKDVWDTAWQASITPQDRAAALIPFYGYGWPSRAGLYGKHGEVYWAHLGRGTSFRPRGPWRERARRIAARLGSPRARKILSYQQDRAAFLKKGWEIVKAPS